MLEVISTTKNKKYKYIKSLLQKKMRQSEGVYTVEGRKSVCDAIESGCDILLIAVSESYFKEYGSNNGYESIIVKDELFGGLCDTKTPQGIIAVIGVPKTNNISISQDKLYVYCDNIQDPGNLGTIIRTADAAGLGGVLLSEGCADAYSPKTVRSSMGSFFNIDIITDFSHDRLFSLKDKGFALVSGALTPDAKLYTNTDFTKPTVIIIGNEANGVSEDILNNSEHIIIPIYGKAESLNAGVAASIIMYEAVKQRRDN